MKLIQPVLVLLLLLFAYVYLSRFRSRIRDRAIVIALIASGIVLVAAPGLANALAHLFGVGRGADLVTYLSLAGLSFLWLKLYGRIRKLEEQVTVLSREVAIGQALPQPARRAATQAALQSAEHGSIVHTR